MLYVSDLNLWLKFSSASTYGDDTVTSTAGVNLTKLIKDMESDAVEVLTYMALNGLVANSKKKALVLLNAKHADGMVVNIGGL